MPHVPVPQTLRNLIPLYSQAVMYHLYIRSLLCKMQRLRIRDVIVLLAIIATLRKQK